MEIAITFTFEESHVPGKTLMWTTIPPLLRVNSKSTYLGVMLLIHFIQMGGV